MLSDNVFNDEDLEGSSDFALLAIPPEIKFVFLFITQIFRRVNILMLNMIYSYKFTGGHRILSFIYFLSCELIFRERILRLQHENKLLKLQRSSTTQEETELIQTQLEDATARNSELESELR